MVIKLEYTLTPTGNQWERMHYHARSKLKQAYMAETIGQVEIPDQPIDKCRVLATRYSSKVCDYENALYGAAKPINDVLVAKSKSHPYGLGIITDDDPSHQLSFVVKQVKCKRADSRVEVKIRDMSEELVPDLQAWQMSIYHHHWGDSEREDFQEKAAKFEYMALYPRNQAEQIAFAAVHTSYLEKNGE